MKNILQISIFIFFVTVLNTYAQSDYSYYYKGKKVYLTLNKANVTISTFDDFQKSSLSILNLKEFNIEVDNTAEKNYKYANIEFQNALTEFEYFQKIMVLNSNPKIIKAQPNFINHLGVKIGMSDYFYVKLKNSSDLILLQKLALEKNVEIIEQNRFMPLWFTLKCKKNSLGSTLEIANFFFETGNFTSAVPDFLSDDSLCSNDDNFGNLWGLNNTTNPNIDINACQTWNIAQGNGIKVAVLDQGIELSHNDLITNIFPLSYNTETNTSPSQVFANHGTHVAGTIAAIKDNIIQVVGVAPLSQLMSVSNSLAATPNSRIKRADGINWATQNGADVINNSWGSAVQYQAIDDAIENAITNGRNGKGTIIVFSSGNENGPVGYPANVNINIISVGSITSNGSRSSFSNYGSQLDVVAPGTDILSTIPNNQITSLSGTSMASPHVAGVAALILSANPCLTGQQVRDIIEQTSQKVGGYSYTTTSGRPNGTWNEQMGYGLIDAYAAVLMAQSMATQITITGINTICTTANFAAPAGGSSHNWTITSGSSLVSVTNNGTANVTVSALPNASGEITLSLSMVNNCGTVTGAKTIWVGKPQISDVDFTNDLGGNDFCVNIRGKNIANFVINTTTPSILQYHYKVFRGTTLLKDIVSSSPNGFFTTAITGSYTVQCRIENACGWSDWDDYNLFFERCATNRTNSNLYSIYPNPSSETVYIDLVDQNNLPDKEAIITGTLFDLMGQAKSKVQITDNKASLSVQGLKKGVYVLEIAINDSIETHQILVE